MFIAAILLPGYLLGRLNQAKLLSYGETAVIYFIGGLSSFWLIERVVSY